MGRENPTIVFVDGGWADATGFDGSIRALRERGFAVIGAASPPSSSPFLFVERLTAAATSIYWMAHKPLGFP